MQTAKNEKTFFPYYFFEITVVALFTLEAVLILAVLFPPAIGREIDFSAQFSPRPEWYFLFLYELTKFFPGKWTFVGAVLLPGLGFSTCSWRPSWTTVANDRSESVRWQRLSALASWCR